MQTCAASYSDNPNHTTQMGLRMDDIHTPTVASGSTTNGTANGTEKKLTFQELSTKKTNLEAELSALGSVLDSHGVNMRTGLTTFDGYPRADIDVAQIRTTRAQIIRLKNDHKDVMKKLEAAIEEHFASNKGEEESNEQTRAPPAVQPVSSGTTANASTANTNTASSTSGAGSAIEPPFAKVNSIVPNSPAAQAGLQAGDKVTRFGTVNWTTAERMQRLAAVVQQNEDRSILVRVLRETTANSAPERVELQLTPRRDWGGRGLLGCHLLPA